MNNISSLTEQTITLVPSAEFCIPVLSFVLCLLHCTVPALSLRADLFLSSVARIRESGRWEEEGKHIFYGNAQTHQTTHRQVREHGAQWNVSTMYQEKWHFLLWLCCILASALPLWWQWCDFFLQYRSIWNYMSTCSNSYLSCWWSSGHFCHQMFDRTLYLCLCSIAARIFIVIWEIDYERNIRHRGSDQSCHGPRRSPLRLLPISLQFHIGRIDIPNLGANPGFISAEEQCKYRVMYLHTFRQYICGGNIPHCYQSHI